MTRFPVAIFLIFIFQATASLPAVEINSVQMNIMTRSRVDCSAFEAHFDAKKESKTLKSGRQVEAFLKKWKNLEKWEDSRTTEARAQIIIKYYDHEEKICADRFSVYRNNICYKMTDDLRKIIW